MIEIFIELCVSKAREDLMELHATMMKAEKWNF